MDRAPSKLPNSASRLIAMAVSLVGSGDAVREHMRASQTDFTDYCAGQKEPGWSEFDRLIALIVREQGRMIAQNRELLSRIRQRKGP
jgi:hypothetical protein